MGGSICLWFHSWGQVCKLTHPSFEKAPGEVWSSFITSKQITRSFSNRWQMMSNDAFESASCQGTRILNMQIPPVLRNHREAVMFASTRTENRAPGCQASGLLPATLGGLPGGQRLGKWNPGFSLLWEHSCTDSHLPGAACFQGRRTRGPLTLVTFMLYFLYLSYNINKKGKTTLSPPWDPCRSLFL